MARFFSLLSALTCAVNVAHGQWSPTGYMGAINTPTAQTLPVGSTLFGVTNNIPERTRLYPGVGAFGSVGMGVGLLPELDMSVRLAYDGDTHCQIWGCQTWTRDLSFGAKYQLPFDLPGNSRVAIGVSDVGGAATHFRQNYGVWTSRVGSLDLSLGYGKALSPTALLNGPFASASWWMNSEIRLAVETYRHEQRAGVEWVHRLTPKWLVSGAISSSLSNTPERQKSQASANLIYSWERDSNPSRVRQYSPLQNLRPVTSASEPAPSLRQAMAHPPLVQATESAIAPPQPQTARPRVTDHDLAAELAEKLRKQGFRQVHIGRNRQGDIWHAQFEPIAWRKSQTTALAKALQVVVPWMPNPSQMVLSLSYAQFGHRHLWVHRGCRSSSGLPCLNTQGHAFELSDLTPPDAQDISWIVKPDWAERISAEIEVGPSISHAVGTEYGLFDYSLGLETGWQVPVPGVSGLFAQGYMTRGIAHSDDTAQGRVFHDMRIKNQIQQSMLSYVMHPTHQIYAQANYGFINAAARGSQFDAAWLSQDARAKVSLSAGDFSVPEATYLRYKTRLSRWRYELAPALWALEWTQGQFYMGDRGWQLGSQHMFSDYRIMLYVRESSSPTMPKTRFAGFVFTLPFGPEKSALWGPLSLRGRDLWSDGLETKVGSTDNMITRGYGQATVVRHGMVDMVDFDRRVPIHSSEGLYRLNNALQLP